MVRLPLLLPLWLPLLLKAWTCKARINTVELTFACSKAFAAVLALALALAIAALLASIAYTFALLVQAGISPLASTLRGALGLAVELAVA